MNKTTVVGMTISTFERTHAWWRYFWPFQSRRALLTILVVLAVGLPIVAGFSVLVGSNAVFQGVIFSALCGLYVGLYPYLPARLTFATRGEAQHFASDVQAQLVRLRYVASEQSPRAGRFHYRSKRPRLWRWDEEDMELLVHEHELVLSGPVGMLTLIRARLLPPEDFAYLDKKV
jgi:hypothetical protein